MLSVTGTGPTGAAALAGRCGTIVRAGPATVASYQRTRRHCQGVAASCRRSASWAAACPCDGVVPACPAGEAAAKRIEAQGGNQAHLTLPAGMPELDDTVGLIPKHGDGDLRQPAAPPESSGVPTGRRSISPRRSLTCGVGAGTLKMGKARHIPGWRDDQGQHDPAKATGADGALAAGSQRVAVMTALADTSAPASLQSFVNDEREAAASGIVRQQTATRTSEHD